MEQDKLIFVAEDDRHQVLLFEIAMKKARLPETHFRFFGNGLEVRRYLEEAERGPLRIPDLMVLDLKMPMMSGFELIAWLREHPKYKSTPVAVMSCSDDEQDKARARRLGCNYYFVKTPDLDELVRTVTGFYMTRFAPLNGVISTTEQSGNLSTEGSSV